MAPKSAAPAPKSAAPASESSASSYTSSGSGEEDVQVSQPQKKPAAAPPKPSFNAPIEEDSSTGDYNSSDDSASDSDAAAEPSPPAKPLPPPPAPATSDKKKRKEAPPPPLDNNNESGGGGGVEGQKRQRFQRLWTEDDEITILHGILNHQAKTGALPLSKTDMAAFRDSIHKNLTTDINIRQLTEKVRRFRSKYDKNPSTASSGKPHDSAVHELCHKIWGASNGAGSAGKHGKGKEVEGNDNSVKVKPQYTFLKHAVTGMGDCLPCSVTLEEVLDFVDDSKAMAIEERLKKLWRLQLKNQAREMEIKKETNMMLMEALEKMG